jgi:glycine hydroxymethyltransferase
VLAGELVDRGYTLVTGGTDNHLMLMDLRAHPFSGADAELALHRAGITVNKNAVPNDPRPPAVTSGIRIGTPAVTTRGLGVAEIRRLAAWMDEALRRRDDASTLERIRGEVGELCRVHPLYTRRRS